MAKTLNKNGKIIGLEKNHELIKKATENAKINKLKNIEFILWKTKTIPLKKNSADIIISNNSTYLTSENTFLINEAYRILKPGGKILISSIGVDQTSLIEHNKDIEYKNILSCDILDKKNQLKKLNQAGFEKINIISEKTLDIDLENIYKNIKGKTISFHVEAHKPK